ncbi:hypothetical protein QBC45DRAFT_222260 [Copromyces sp. CBS 386.78]|nr:hypothetical protein QBC45DRAFT_222260 [Copromyces sp. CBS 386.78]
MSFSLPWSRCWPGSRYSRTGWWLKSSSPFSVSGLTGRGEGSRRVASMSCFCASMECPSGSDKLRQRWKSRRLLALLRSTVASIVQRSAGPSKLWNKNGQMPTGASQISRDCRQGVWRAKVVMVLLHIPLARTLPAPSLVYETWACLALLPSVRTSSVGPPYLSINASHGFPSMDIRMSPGLPDSKNGKRDGMDGQQLTDGSSNFDISSACIPTQFSSFGIQCVRSGL